MLAKTQHLGISGILVDLDKIVTPQISNLGNYFRKFPFISELYLFFNF